MTRLDPLTQTMTMPGTAVPARVTPAPPNSVAPAEQLARFVAAIDRTDEMNALEAGYAAVRVRRRMNGQISGLSDLDMRLSGAAQGLRGARATPLQRRAQEDAAAEAASEARMAELRGAAAALNVAISGARSDVAAVLRQMQAELVATMEALAKGSEAGPSTSADAALAGASGSGEQLVRQASALSARASRG